jgi:hypothetical protein
MSVMFRKNAQRGTLLGAGGSKMDDEVLFDEEVFAKTMKCMDRKYRWKGKACVFLMKPVCEGCSRVRGCIRLRENDIIMRHVLSQEWRMGCPDFETAWKVILNEK